MKTVKTIAAAALMLWLPSLGWAATLVVDEGSAAANDHGPGTDAAPLKTVQAAADRANAGDIILVKPGIYRENVHLTHSGKPGLPITFLAAPGGDVLLTGADIITGWSRVSGAAPIYSVPWDHIFAIDYHNGKPIEHHPEDAPLWGRAEQVIVDGRQLLPTASLSALEKDWSDQSAEMKSGAVTKWLTGPVPGLGGSFGGKFFTDTTMKKLYLWTADGTNPAQHTVQASTRAQVFGVNPWENRDGVSYVEAHGFHFRYGATFPQRAAVWLHGSHNLLEDCIVEDMAGSGAAVDGTMRRCVVRGCGQTGGAASGPDFLNEDCLWEGNCWKPIDRGWDAGGVKMALTDGGTFRRCTFRRNGGPGLWFDIDVHNVLVTQCVFEENEGSGLFIEISRNNRVVNNLSVRNAIGVVGSKAGGSWSEGGIVLAESENCLVCYNTCVGNKDGITFREQGPRPLQTDDAGTIPYHDHGDVVVGNVCAYNQGYQLGLWYDNGFFGRHPSETKKYPTEEAFSEYLKSIPDKVYDPTKQGLVIDHNLYFGDPGKPLTLYGVPWRVRHQEFKSLADFTAKTGFDAHSVVADPEFTNRTSGEYAFQPGSRAVTEGVGWQHPPGHL